MSIYKPETPEDFVECLYNYRTNKFKRYKTRYKNEYADLKLTLDKTKG